VTGAKITPLGTEEKPAQPAEIGMELFQLQSRIFESLHYGSDRLPNGMGLEFNDYFKELLKSKDLSQRDFEKLMGYKDGVFRNVLRGIYGPRLQDLAKMAEVLELDRLSARKLNEMALEAHGCHSLAEELRSAHRRIDELKARLDRVEALFANPPPAPPQP
jgi:transcriptional regulator with XRE-family HTH domain